METEDQIQAKPGGIFKDRRREGNNRRYRDSVMRDQGRRAKDRRKPNEQFSPRPWWLRVNYLVSESANRYAQD